MKILLISLSLLLSSCSTSGFNIKEVKVITNDIVLEVPEKIKEVEVEVETFDFRYVNGAVIMLLLMLFTISITKYIKER